jgi:hypothetical protein
MLGLRQSFDAVPFFWSRHHDVTIDYVGHAPPWDELDIDSDIAARDCAVRYAADACSRSRRSIGTSNA